MAAVKRMLNPGEMDDFCRPSAGFDALVPVKPRKALIQCEISGQWVKPEDIIPLQDGKLVAVTHWYNLKRAAQTLREIAKEIAAQVEAGHVPREPWLTDASRKLKTIKFYGEW